jgi:hypothetical protein
VKLALDLRPALEMGALSANAELQDPDVRVELAPDHAPAVRITEGAVDLRLQFPDRDAARRFVGRVSALRIPRS